MTTRKPNLRTTVGRAACAAILALVVTGCGATAPPELVPENYSGAARDLIAVASIPGRHFVHLGGKGGHLTKAERDRLAAFVTAIAANRPESLRIALRGPAGPAQLRAVAEALTVDGVNPKHIVLADRLSGPPAPPGTIVVEAERAVAAQPHCPGWVDHISAPEDNRTEPNFGCSDVSNFAAMVADPHHLIVGASSVLHDGERGATSVANYRAGKVKELPVLNEQFSVIPAAR